MLKWDFLHEAVVASFWWGLAAGFAVGLLAVVWLYTWFQLRKDVRSSTHEQF